MLLETAKEAAAEAESYDEADIEPPEPEPVEAEEEEEEEPFIEEFKVEDVFSLSLGKRDFVPFGTGEVGRFKRAAVADCGACVCVCVCACVCIVECCTGIGEREKRWGEGCCTCVWLHMLG